MWPEVAQLNAKGFLTIKDAETGEIIRKLDSAIHFGNITATLALALSGDPAGHARYMAFGNGGTSINATGQIDYFTPNVSILRDINASLYNQTYRKDLLPAIDDPANNITT